MSQRSAKMKLSFRKFLETGELPPFVLGTTRREILQLLGKPSEWASNDEGIGPPVRGYDSSDSISYGSLTFSLLNDRIVGISVAADIMSRDWSYPVEVISFPQQGTMISEVADYMRRLELPFEDISANGDGSALRTAASVRLVAPPGAKGLLTFCYTEPRGPK